MMELRKRIAERDAHDRLRKQRRPGPAGDQNRTKDEILKDAVKEFEERLEGTKNKKTFGA